MAQEFTAPSAEEKRLAARVEDLAELARKGSAAFTPFLNEREQLVAEAVAGHIHAESCAFHGGYPEAVRRMAGFFPPWEERSDDRFPIGVIAIILPKRGEPSHRDVLGSLMALGINRDRVGDILIDAQTRRCHVFVHTSIAAMVLRDLTKIGGLGVRCEMGTPGTEFVRDEQFQPVRGTVHSPRVDALVSLLTGRSREKSAGLIQAELVQRNYRTVEDGAEHFHPGDIFTIRGYGKFRVDEIGKPTKKGRLPIDCSKYL